MLTLHQSTRDDEFLVALRIPDLNWNTAISSYYGYFGVQDWIGSLLQWAYIPYMTDCDDAFGNVNFPKAEKQHMSNGLKPQRKLYDPYVDSLKYSNPIGVAFDLVTNFELSSPQMENQVAHTSWRGDVIEASTPIYTYDLGYTVGYGDFTVPCVDQTYASAYHYRYIPSNNSGRYAGPLVPYVYLGGLVTKSLGEVFELISSQISSSSNKGTVSYVEDLVPYGSETILDNSESHLVRGFLYPDVGLQACGEFEYDTAALTCQYVHYTATNTLMRKSTIKMKFGVLPTTVDRSLRIGVNMVASVNFTADIHSEWYLAVSGAHDDYRGWQRLSHVEDVRYFSTSTDDYWGPIPLTQPRERSLEPAPEFFNPDKGVVLHFFNDWAKSNAGFFRPSVMFSFCDAIDSYRAVNGDYLEVIYQAEKLTKLVPNVSALADLLLSVESGNVPETIDAIVAFLAQVKLQFTFGVNKMAGNALEIGHSVDKLASAIESISKPQTLYGKFSITMGTVDGIDGVFLHTRTKVRIGGATAPFILKLLQIDSWGLSPRTGHLWDLVPFSWLIDMFNNQGGRFDVIDSVIYGLMMDVQFCTHSLTIEHPVPKATLQRQNLVAVSPVIMKHYIREVSRFVPMIFRSEYDFGRSQRPPDGGIIAALLISLFGPDKLLR